MQTLPYRWRPTASFVAHLWKATTQQHHRGLIPVLAQHIPPDAVVFDVGAHAGQYVKLFARRAAAGHVYAFEPGSYARSILRTVVWLHRLDNVTVVPAALGSAPGLETLTIPLKRPRSLGFGLAHFGQADRRWGVVAQELALTTTVDSVVATLRLARLDFIKADIEGWELLMLDGARATLDRFRPSLLLELTHNSLARAGHRLDDAFALFAALGYRAFALGGDGELAPVAAPREGDFLLLPAERSRD